MNNQLVNQDSTKTCSRCQERKPLSEFGNDKYCKDGLRSQCKKCLKERRIKNEVKLFQKYKKYQIENPITHKTCYNCKQTKTINEFNKNKRKKDCLCYVCKICEKESADKNYKKRLPKYKKQQLENPIDEKICNCCKLKKDVNEFYKDQTKKDGLQTKCKVCTNQKVKKYNSEHKEEFKIRDKKYNLEHKEEKLIRRIKRKNNKYEGNSLVNCKQCNKEFFKQNAQIKRWPNHFCSRSCVGTYVTLHKIKGYRVSKLELGLQKQLQTLYPTVEFHFNRKDTIESELDIYIPKLKLAFEINGIFHYEQIYSNNNILKIKNNDKKKVLACKEHNVELVVIDISKQQGFKPTTSQIYLDVIIKTINKKLVA